MSSTRPSTHKRTLSATRRPPRSSTRSRSSSLPSKTPTFIRASSQSPSASLGPGPTLKSPVRTTKTSHKLVVLPSTPQTRPLHAALPDEHEYDTDVEGLFLREKKSIAESMSKEERERAGFKRITAYCIAESLRMKRLASFLKREHNVAPRVFDEAMYTIYHLPLLPGYGPNTSVRASLRPKPPNGKSPASHLSEAEEIGYQGSYFVSHVGDERPNEEGFITGPPFPVEMRHSQPVFESDAEPSEVERPEPAQRDRERQGKAEPETEENVAEVVFFDYGVVVFFGLLEAQERMILDDIERAGVCKRKIKEADWEVEECHFMHDPNIAHPRIYNDFFTLKSPSHLLKLSIAHALAQSTLLSYYESLTTLTLSSSQTLSIPKQLATHGALTLRRKEALMLTGRLFKLRQDVNLVSNVLDTPELFWSEASLKNLYDAVREYMEIGSRVERVNEKLVVASEFLDAIHDHLNNSAMERITWIVIWLIVVAILVELGEVIARLVVHATTANRDKARPEALSREDALVVLARMMT